LEPRRSRNWKSWRSDLVTRRRRVLIRDVVLAIVVALMLFGAWKLIALAFALGPP
jgi:hypothetical protein